MPWHSTSHCSVEKCPQSCPLTTSHSPIHKRSQKYKQNPQKKSETQTRNISKEPKTTLDPKAHFLYLLAVNNIFQFWKQFSSLFFPLQIMEHKNLHVDNFLQPIDSWQKDRWDKPKTCVPLIFSIWRNDNQDLYSPEVTVIEQAWNIAPAHDVIPASCYRPKHL